MAPLGGAIFGERMRVGFILVVAAAVLSATGAAAQFGGGIGSGSDGAVRVPSMRDSDPHRHYWIPEGALGPSSASKACRAVIVRKRLADGRTVARKTRRCD
jgi:hypothetical protein